MLNAWDVNMLWCLMSDVWFLRKSPRTDCFILTHQTNPSIISDMVDWQTFWLNVSEYLLLLIILHLYVGSSSSSSSSIEDVCPITLSKWRFKWRIDENLHSGDDPLPYSVMNKKKVKEIKILEKLHDWKTKIFRLILNLLCLWSV